MLDRIWLRSDISGHWSVEDGKRTAINWTRDKLVVDGGWADRGKIDYSRLRRFWLVTVVRATYSGWVWQKAEVEYRLVGCGVGSEERVLLVE